MSTFDPAKLYDEYYYAHGCAAPYERTPELLQFFEGIARRINTVIAPRSILDAGCAWGFLVEHLRRLGVEAWGIDVSVYAIQQVNADIRPYCWIGSITDPLPQKYDLIVSIEVLEHMPQAQAEAAVANLCQSADDIIISSTPFDYREVTHFNVQPPEYWAELFARQGFVRDVDFDASFITPWAVRFRRSIEPLPRVVRDYERRFWGLWKENVDLRSQVLEMRDQMAQQERERASPAQHTRLGGLKHSRIWRLMQRIKKAVWR